MQLWPVEHFLPHFFFQISADLEKSEDKSAQLVRDALVQLNKYETVPNFIQLNQNLTSDFLLI